MLEDFGLTPVDAAVVGMGHFPVGGYAAFTDDWLMPRAGPPPHLHQGNDIFAAMGTAIRATVDGVFRSEEGGLGGLGMYVTAPDGTFYYYAHTQRVADGLTSGALVKQGQIIGYVGDSGNAVGGAPHCHFEIHPAGGPAVNPKPILDGWLAEALAQVPALVASYQHAEPRVAAALATTRRFDLGGQGFSGDVAMPVGQLLWESAVSPAGSGFRVAQVELGEAAAAVDWAAWQRRQQAEAAAQQQADDLARLILLPLTPRALVGLP